MDSVLGEPLGQSWLQLLELAIALVLSALIGLEREARGKSAGLRTHALIGFSSALIMLVSKYGFSDVLADKVVLDPSRVAAQIVSGIGFIGGGLIFVKRDLVRGLTTAAAVWLTTAVGMAAGAGLPILASATTAGYFAVIYGLTPIAARLGSTHPRSRHLEMTYQDGRGVLRKVLNTCTNRGWVVTQLTTHPDATTPLSYDTDARPQHTTRERKTVAVLITMNGITNFDDLLATLSELDGVLAVTATNPDHHADPEVE